MVSRVIPVDPFDLVIFGATGDLARRKIIPGLFHRFVVGPMPAEARIIGAARSEMTRDAFVELIRESLKEFAPRSAETPAQIAAFLKTLHYVCVDATGEAGWRELGEHLRLEAARVFYLSVSPALFGAIADNLDVHGLAIPQARIVVEKPFGHDLASAKALNADPIIRRWEDARQRPTPYDPGSAGPEDALMLLHRDGRRWPDLEP